VKTKILKHTETTFHTSKPFEAKFNHAPVLHMQSHDVVDLTSVRKNVIFKIKLASENSIIKNSTWSKRFKRFPEGSEQGRELLY
jgi:hypothetical protein